MSRSLSYLRRGLLGIALVGSLGFGATQAFAEPKGEPVAAMGTCPVGMWECCMTCYGQRVLRCPC